MNNCSFLEQKNTSKKGKTARKKNRSEISSKYAHFNFYALLTVQSSVYSDHWLRGNAQKTILLYMYRGYRYVPSSTEL